MPAAGVFLNLPIYLQLLFGVLIGLIACVLYGFSYSAFEGGRIKLGCFLLLSGLALFLTDGLLINGFIR